MSSTTNKIIKFWQELKRRKVIYFLIGYVAACFAIIEFFRGTSETFSIPENTLRLLYLLAAIGLPAVIILPWVIYRRKKDDVGEDPTPEFKTHAEEDKKPMHNLPSQLTTFIGRQKEMQTVKDLINEHRLITLTGAGGCGKTRLACEVAIQLVPDFKSGVWLVNLAPITNEDLVAKEITEALTITEIPNQLIIDTLIENIKDQELLIILDNCEHLVKACAEISRQLIQSVHRLKILATSRQSLNVTGEQVWRVPSLTLLDPKDIVDVESVKESEAVMLFKDRAQLKNPDFELELENIAEVVTICNKVDGIPLALELVASRTKHMDPQMILERFTDKFDLLSSSDPGTSKRQQTLQATIEWSYNLLLESEKMLFARLSVFSGGFDLAAAEEVCSDEVLPEEIILDALSRLVDRSLVHTMKADDHSMRYNMLEILRQFAQQALKSWKEDDLITKKHLKYFLSLAEEAYEEQYESQLKWMSKLTAEQDNLLVALNWSLNNSKEEFMRLSGSLGWFWKWQSNYLTAKEYLEKAVVLEPQNPETHALIMHGLGYILTGFGEFDRSISLIEKSLLKWESANNLKGHATSLSLLGYLYVVKVKDEETGSRYIEQALELVKRVAEPGFSNQCLTLLCASLAHSKQFEKAIPYVEELLIASEKLKQPFDLMSARHYHSDCALGIKDYKEAERRYGLGMKTGMEYENYLIAFADMQGIAFSVSGQQRWAKALRLNAASCEKARSMGITMYGLHEFWDEWIDTYIEGAKKEVGEELSRKYEEEGIAMGFEKAVEYALDFEKD